MRNYRIYLYTTISFVLVYILIISLIVSPLIIKVKSTTLLQNNINLATQEIQQVSVISGNALANNLPKETIVNSIQEAISGSDNESIYLTVFNWSGTIISHPDITKVKTKNDQKSNTISNIKSVVTGEELYQHVTSIESYDKETSEVIALRPIPSSDLIIAAHLNIEDVHTQTNTFKDQVRTVFFILGLILLLLLLIIIRVLSIYYERIIDRKTAKLEDGVLNLSKLNTSLENYQKSIAELQTNTEKQEVIEKNKEKEEDIKEIPKQRLLTYIRNELMPIAITDISYIYVENSISYVVRKDGKRYTANDSLDQIYASLDPKLFFRANRQTIVAIYAIDKIIKYGNSALKIEMQPISEIDIIIGKNKVSVFKKWLDM
ncbi:LytR/AlgR family response regulator transcription factor [Kordia sp.]|uniref:LytR/AlgR family response regulator transcription factor n=1 Tax=Kordia sp. TaxID=1965332 RepID=UPI003B59207D